MGKTSKPVKWLVHPMLMLWPVIQKMIGQGHVIEADPRFEEFDIILGPNCWLMDKEHEEYLALAVKESRLP